MKKVTIIVVCILLLFASAYVIAQKNNLPQKNDSSNAFKLNDYTKQIAASELQRIQDSVRKAELELQLSSLKTTDILKKEELQKQLQILNDKKAIRLANKKAQIDSLRLTAKSYPVTGFFNDTLFLIYSKSGSFSPGDRAAAISKKINNLAGNFRFSADSLKLTSAENTVDIVYGENIILSVSENDAIWNNSTKEVLATKYRDIIGKAVVKYKSEISFISILKRIGLSLFALLIIGILIYYIGKLFKWTAVKIEQQEDKLIKGIVIKNYTLYDAKRQVKVLLSANTILKWFLILLLIYITLPILFGIFPWTKNLAETLLGFILNPVKRIALALWNYLPNLITIIVIIVVFRYVLKGISFLKTEVEKGNLHLPGFYAEWANPTYQIVRVLVFAFLVVVIFPYLPGSDSPIFRGVSVFLGFLFTFGSAGSLSNIMAGIILTYMRLFTIGDRVKIGEVVGDVIEKSLLVTRVRTIKNEIISIPNSMVMSSHTINYSSDAPDKGLILHTTVTIGYDVPWRDMHLALIDAALKTELILKTPEPFVLQTSLDDFYVSYQINAYVREANKQAGIYSALHQNIQDTCFERGIEILSPHYRAARDGNMTSIPASYLPDDYQKPSFDIKAKKDNEPL